MKLIEKAKEELVEIANEQGYWGFVDYLDSDIVSGILEYTTSDYFDDDKNLEYSSIHITMNNHGDVGYFLFGIGEDNTFKGVE